MSIVSNEVLERLGPSATPGQKVGRDGWHTILDPAQALWKELRDLVDYYDRTHFQTTVTASGIPRKRTHYDQGVLYGRMQAKAETLAYILLGHNYVHGDAGERLIQAAREANKEEGT